MSIRTFLSLSALPLALLLGWACSSSDSSASSTGAATGLPIGSACKVDADCEAGDFCSTDDPGGQCLKTCAAAADCPSGSTCTDELKCYQSCSAASDCTRSGYACVDSMTFDAKAAKTCDVAPAPGVIGDACTTNADCASTAFCSLGDPGGQCLQTCAAQSDCPDGSTCTDEMKCYKTCTSATDCTRDGYTCVDSMTVTATPSKTCDVPG